MTLSASGLGSGLFAVPPGKLASVVTTLEMRMRPEALDEPAAPGPALVRVRDPDPGWYRRLFRAVGEDWLWWSRLALSDGALAAIIRDPAVEVYSLAGEGAAQSLVELDFRATGACELAFFGLARPLTGRGLGPAMIRQATERAWRRAITRFWVHTCTLDHPAALRFYLHSGFVPVQLQVEVADDPRATGLLPPDAAPLIPRL